MFGYYVGLSYSEKSSYARFFAGFLSGGLVLGVVLSSYYSALSLLAIGGLIAAVGLGMYFGGIRPAFHRKKIDSAIKLGINSLGWAFQGAGAMASLAQSVNVSVWVPIVIVVAGLVVGVGYKWNSIVSMFKVEVDVKVKPKA